MFDIVSLPFNRPGNVTYDECGNTWEIIGSPKIVYDSASASYCLQSTAKNNFIRSFNKIPIGVNDWEINFDLCYTTDRTSSSGDMYPYGVETTNSSGMQMSANRTGKQDEYFDIEIRNGSVGVYAYSTIKTSKNVWYHYRIYKENIDYYIYINNRLAAHAVSFEGSSYNFYYTRQITIFSERDSENTNSRSFIGKMKNFKISLAKKYTNLEKMEYIDTNKTEEKYNITTKRNIYHLYNIPYDSLYNYNINDSSLYNDTYRDINKINEYNNNTYRSILRNYIYNNDTYRYIKRIDKYNNITKRNIINNIQVLHNTKRLIHNNINIINYIYRKKVRNGNNINDTVRSVISWKHKIIAFITNPRYKLR